MIYACLVVNLDSYFCRTLPLIDFTTFLYVSLADPAQMFNLSQSQPLETLLECPFV